MEINAQYFDCLCRTCMNKVEASSHDGTTKPQQQWLSIFDLMDECGALRIAELLSEAVPQIVVQPSDELPKKICSECLQRLLNVYRFQQMCLQSDKQMHELRAKQQTEAVIKCEVDENSSDSYPDLPCSSTLQNLQQSSIQEPLPEATVQIVKPEVAQSNAAEHLQDNKELVEHCNDSQGPFEECIKNEPIEDDELNSEYSDGETMHSTISVMKDEIMEPEDKQLNDASSRYKCDLCNKSYKKRGILNKHLKLHKIKSTSEEYCHACHLCSESYKNVRTLARHLKQEHSIDRILRNTCGFCNKDFVCHSSLRRHLSIHTSERPFSCADCGKSFAIKEYLAQHRVVHTKDKAYECPHCPLTFISSAALTHHKVIHKAAKRHECDICGKKCRLLGNLRKHKRIHSNEKPHKCDVCEKRFGLIQTLKVHMRTHTGEKPHKCKYCERAFSTTVERSRHLRSHLGKNIHRCKFCPLDFPSYAEMRLHLTSHKNEDPETRERNLKALREEEAKVKQKILKEKTEGQSTVEQQQHKLSKNEIEQQTAGILAEQRTSDSEDTQHSGNRIRRTGCSSKK